ncbi:MAG: Septum formation protein Maf [Bacteroidetes bacterium ADurb.Bin090]|nr:MAG: Septum formation protein Maf [Bacteroidetes bacterium ADurb.Bin090]
MITDKFPYKLVLASNSPRRRDLLAGLGLPFEFRIPPEGDESYPPDLRAEEIPLFLARAKAEACRGLMAAGELFITADTIVWHQDKVFGKPRHKQEAVEMLRALSGSSHQVFTAVCLTTQQAQRSFCSSSQVRFCRLEEEEIRWYVEHYSPLDKAGAYGIQEWIGYVGVEYIRGSYFNVMGLPVHRLYRELLVFGSQAAGRTE